MPNIIVDRRLFLTADKDRLVEPDDPEAAFLWAGEGDEVTEEAAKAVGYTGGKKVKAEADQPAADEPEAKEADAPEDKAEPAPAEDKAVKKPTRKRGGG